MLLFRKSFSYFITFELPLLFVIFLYLFSISEYQTYLRILAGGKVLILKIINAIYYYY